MPRNLLATFIVALLIGIAAFVLWPEEGSGSIGVDSGQDPAQESQDDRIEATSDVVPSDGQAQVDGVRTEDVSNADGGDSAKIHPSYAGDDGILVSIVDDETGQAVALADLYIVDILQATRGQKNSAYRHGASSLNPFCREFGRHYRADEKGQVSIQRGEEFFFALAEKNDRFSFSTDLVTDESELTLRLKANRTFIVTVVDATGSTLSNVPVDLQTGGWQSSSARATVLSDSKGTARFEDLDTHLLVTRRYGSVYLALGFPIKFENLGEGQRAELTEEMLEIGEVTLTMPPTGRVQVNITDSLGQPSSVSGWVVLENHEPGGGIHLGTRVAKRSVNSRAEFDWIGIDAPLTAIFQGAGANNYDEVIAKGPQQAGDFVEITIKRPARAFLTGTILDAEGKPMVEQRVHRREYYDTEWGGGSAGGRFNTDSQGRFRYELEEIEDEGQVYERSIKFTVKSEEFGDCDATVELRVEFAPGDHELGDIILVPIPILLAGRVLDLEGNPLAKAEVKLQYSHEYLPGKFKWRDEYEAETKSTSNGSFRILGEISNSPAYQAVVKLDGFESLVQGIELGSTESEFRLKRGAVMLGSMQIPADAKYIDLRVRLLDSAGTPARSKLTPSDDPTLVDFRFEGKTDTPYTFMVETSFGEEIFKLGNLIMSPTRETRPPELQPVDLRDRFLQIKFEVRNVAGELIPTNFHTKLGGSSRSRSGSIGDFTILTLMPIDEIKIMSPGYNHQILVNVDRDQSVVLKKALEVSLRVPSKYLNYRGTKLMLWSDICSESKSINGRSFDQSGHVSLYAPETGEYSVRLWFSVTLPEGRKLLKLSEFPFKLTESGQVVQVPINQEELDRKIDELLDPQ